MPIVGTDNIRPMSEERKREKEWVGMGGRNAEFCIDIGINIV